MFLDEIVKAAGLVKQLIRKKHVKYISQFDCDGITSSAIISKSLVRENASFELRIVKQLTEETIGEISADKDNLLIFTDCGSGQINLLKPLIEKSQVLIIDHHKPKFYESPNLIHLNPLLFGEEEICSSLISYLFAKSLNQANTDLVSLAIVGGIGDIQDEKWEFKGLANEILREAESEGKISVAKDLRLYGRVSRPLHQALAFSFDPYIPNISGSESNAIQFLTDIGIPVKNSGEWRRLNDLTLDEKKKLASAIIGNRTMTDEVDDIFGDVFTLNGKPDELQDAREFSTLINACGRTGNHDIGVRLCLDDFTILEKAWHVMDNYKRMIASSMNWARENRSSVSETDNAYYMVAENKIPDAIIGTVTSMMMNSGFFDKSKPVFGFANIGREKVKVSARSPRIMTGIDLSKIISEAVMSTGFEGGGHAFAAGAFIPKQKEQEFISIVDKLIREVNGSQA